MARKMTEWPSKRRPLTKIRPSDGCKGEAAHQMTCNALPPGQRKPGTVGMAAGPEVAIMDESAPTLLSQGEVGEIVIKGSNVTPGYENNPTANAENFTEGWFRTGDVSRIREDGRVELLGRIHNLIPKGEVKISPLEIETVMAEHPGVAVALAVGLPDGAANQTIHLLVVAKPGATLKRDILLDWASRHLERIKRPGRIHLVDDLPKGRTGKVDRIAAKRMIGSNLLKESTGGRQADPVV